jgi:hypothetical protein
MDSKYTDVNIQELIRQTDAAFAEMVPAWKGKKLTGKDDEKALRNAWNGIFEKVAYVALGRLRDIDVAERFRTGA